MKVVYTQRSYDIFHSGHVNFLKRSSKFGDVIVGLLSDVSFGRYRGYSPINKFEDRKKVLESCKYVSKVIETDNNETKGDIMVYAPDVITIGTDWTQRSIYKQWGVPPALIDDELVYIPYTPGISTTSIKEKIRNDKF